MIQTSRWNTRVSQLLIVAALTILAVQRAHSMPSREIRQLGPFAEGNVAKEEHDELEESTLFAQETPPIITNFPTNRTRRYASTKGSRRDAITTKISVDTDAIKFPEDSGNQRRNFVPQPLPDCEGKTFCEETVSTYPQDYMRNIISKTESVKFVAAVDQISISERFDSSDGGETLCGSETKLVFPKTAQNEDKEWLFVVQDEEEGYQQGVRVENCNQGTAGDACKIIEGTILGYTTSCKQKYVSRVLAAVRKNGTAVTEKFSMPSSCCCQIKFVGDGIGSRIAGGLSKNQSPAPMKSGRKN